MTIALPEKAHRIARHCVFGSMIFSCGFILWLTYMRVIDGNPPVKIISIQTSAEVYAPGDSVTLITQACKNKRYPVTVYPKLVQLPNEPSEPEIDGIIYTLPAVSTIGVKTGCNVSTVTGLFKVPDDLPAGRYYLKVTNVYTVNFLTTRSVDWRTNVFTVSPGPL